MSGRNAGLRGRCLAYLLIGQERPSGGNSDDRAVGQNSERKEALYLEWENLSPK